MFSSVIPPEASRGTGKLEFADPLDCLTHLIGRHIVEQHRFSAMLQNGIEFLQRAHLDLDLLGTTPIAQRPFQRLDRATRQSDVIVLDQHTVAEIEAMIMAAATGHSVLIEDAQSGNSLARIQDYRLRSRDGVDIASSQGGDAAHALHDVQDHALAGKDDPRIMYDDCDRLSLAQANAVEDLGVAGHLRMRGHGAVEHGKHIEDAVNTTYAGEHAVLLGEYSGRSALVHIDAGVGGGVASSAIFLQRIFQNCRDPAACPVHDSMPRCVVVIKYS